MKERLIEFLRVENKSSAQFAEEIGVQPSGISHILSGRNKPSLDFIIKMLEKYQFISTEWLLFGKGSMYKDPKMQTLFDEVSTTSQDDAGELIRKEPVKSDQTLNAIIKDQSEADISRKYRDGQLKTTRIVWFYDDKSFEEYLPR